MTQAQIDNADYIYIEKLKEKSERQLKVMLDTLEKETIKITAEKTKIENKLKEKIKKSHFVKDLVAPYKNEDLEAINEVKNNEVISFDNHKDAMEYLNAEN